MSYLIRYQSTRGTWLKKLTCIRLPLLAVLCFLLFVLMVNSFWPEGEAYIRSRTQARKESAAVMALDQLAEDLLRGEPLSAAFSELWNGIQP